MADVDKNSNTVKKQLPEGMRPFVKGDPRINRKGRPRKADMLRDAILSRWDSPAIDGKGNPVRINGKPATYGDMVIEKMYRDTKLFPELLNRGFGKVKDETDHSGEVTIKVEYGKRDNTEPS